jgi:hypothetical protein
MVYLISTRALPPDGAATPTSDPTASPAGGPVACIRSSFIPTPTPDSPDPDGPPADGAKPMRRVFL